MPIARKPRFTAAIAQNRLSGQSKHILLHFPGLPSIVREGVLRVTPSLLTLEVEGVRDPTTRQCNERQQRARPLVAKAIVNLNGEQHDTRRKVLAADADADAARGR